jgi:dienelactone hydrolase
MSKYAAAAALLLSGCITTQQPVVRGVDMNVIYPTINERTANNKYPVVVLSHGAGGLGKNYFKWASYFRSLGFATLTIDHHTARGYYGKTFLSNGKNPTTKEGLDIRQADTPAVFAKLNSDPKVDKKRIWLAGWSAGAGFVYDGIGREGVLGGILFYPYTYACRADIVDNKDKPVKVMIGSKDKGLHLCWKQYMDTEKFDFSIYEGAWHLFDLEGMKKTVKEYTNFRQVNEFSPEALKQSISDVKEFLQKETP